MMEGQSKKRSSIEAISNAMSGVFTGYLGNLFVLPMFGMVVTVGTAVWITIVFTGISFGRSYVVRRLFNRWRE